MDRRLVQLLIDEELQHQGQQQLPHLDRDENGGETTVFKDSILQATYELFLQHECKFPKIDYTPTLVAAQLQNDKNQKLNLSLLETHAKTYWTAQLHQLSALHTHLSDQKLKIEQDLSRLQLKRKREQLEEFERRESGLRTEWWSLVRSLNRVLNGVNDLEETCSKYRRILEERDERKEQEEE